jgi:hypothetical protein
MKDWPFLERLRTLTTVASSQAYNLPHDCGQVRSIAVIVSSKRYTPRESPSRDHWDMLNRSTFTSDIPEWYFVYGGQVLLWPTPATSSNTINVNQKCRVIDLNVADYTTGSIVSIANGGVAVIGTGTSWTERMAGRYIRITYSDTANTGDGEWYEIASVTDTTHLTLVRAYGGTAIAAGTAGYTIGQMPLLPEEFHEMPWWAAASDYWGKEGNENSVYFKTKHDDKLKLLVSTWSAPTTNMVIDDGRDDDIINPNLTITI